ncbi:hypothetical protein [Kitasatospora purpeofusca]|uniref:hypothetical protein n=1 Tax=Kitasatospora purpeofusca TaxID=67352 RepID=UPI0036D1D517
MSNYFSLRKHAPEPDPDATVEEQPEETEPQPEEEPAAAARGPVVTGLLGPGAWLAARLGTGWAWGVHGVGVWAITYYGGWAAVAVTAVWVFAVLLFVPREHLDRITNRLEQGTPREDEPVEDTPPADAFVDPLPGILWELIGDASGVHHKSVGRHLHDSGLDTACDRPAVRAALTRRGITVKGSVREADGRVNEGVHRADLQAWQETRSPAANTPVADARSGPVAEP